MSDILLKSREKNIRESWFDSHVILEHDLLNYSRGKDPVETLI